MRNLQGGIQNLVNEKQVEIDAKNAAPAQPVKKYKANIKRNALSESMQYNRNRAFFQTEIGHEDEDNLKIRENLLMLALDQTN